MRNGRWFSQKGSAQASTEGDGSDASGGQVYIQRDSLVNLKVKCGRTESVEPYRVLGFFSKFYNKWFVSAEKKFLWSGSPDQNVRILARLMKKSGSTYQEVTLEADGNWSPKQVYCIQHFNQVVKLDNVLVDMM